MLFISVLLNERLCVYLCGIFFIAFHFISNFNTAEMCVTATDKHINRQRQYKGNNSISFQICPLIGVTFDIFPGQISYVNHRDPYVAPLDYIG
jgi:hypothetical protein